MSGWPSSRGWGETLAPTYRPRPRKSTASAALRIVLADIEDASVVIRSHDDEDTPRVIVTCQSTGSAGFIFDVDAARKRIAKRWPALTVIELDQATRAMEVRVRQVEQERRRTVIRPRRSWLTSWQQW